MWTRHTTQLPWRFRRRCRFASWNDEYLHLDFILFSCLHSFFAYFWMKTAVMSAIKLISANVDVWHACAWKFRYTHAKFPFDGCECVCACDRNNVIIWKLKWKNTLTVTSFHLNSYTTHTRASIHKRLCQKRQPGTPLHAKLSARVCVRAMRRISIFVRRFSFARNARHQNVNTRCVAMAIGRM